jgi:membrane-bound serine protease (ClpP class)
MDLLLNPNVAYLFLVFGFSLAMLAILTPGTGLLELGAVFSLLLAGWGVYNLPLNYWAAGLLILGVFPFVLALRKSGQVIYLAISILALVLGSAFLFQGEEGAGFGAPAVNPILALLVSTLTAGFFWIVARKVIEAETARPTHDLNALIGEIGEARTDISPESGVEGTVLVGSELWSARSKTLIPAGTPVRIIAREGFVLEVEANGKL